MKRRRNTVGLVLASFAGLAGLSVAGCHYSGTKLNLTNSMPLGVWRLTSDIAPPMHGTTVAVCLPEKWAKLGEERQYLSKGECPDGREVVLKQVIAIPGDIVAVMRAGIAVNGTPIPSTLPLNQDENHRPLKACELGDYAVSPGQVWVVSTRDPRSYDSRYFCAIPLISVIGTAIPVITF